MKLKELLDYYAVEYGKPNRIDLRRFCIASDHLIDFFGAGCDVCSIKRSSSRKYRAKRLADGVTDSTILRELGVLQRALNFALADEKIEAAPLLELPKGGPPRERWFTEEEVMGFVGDLSYYAKLWTFIALFSGARKSAVAGLTKDRIDFQMGTIDFRDPSLPQTKKRRAKIAMHEILRPLLSEACEKAGGQRIFPVGYDPYKEIKAVLRKRGIDEKGIACHAFKRTFVTWAALNRADMVKVAATTATSLATLERHYLKVLPQHTADAVNAVQLQQR